MITTTDAQQWEKDAAWEILCTTFTGWFGMTADQREKNITAIITRHAAAANAARQDVMQGLVDAYERIMANADEISDKPTGRFIAAHLRQLDNGALAAYRSLPPQDAAALGIDQRKDPQV